MQGWLFHEEPRDQLHGVVTSAPQRMVYEAWYSTPFPKGKYGKKYIILALPSSLPMIVVEVVLAIMEKEVLHSLIDAT